VDVGLEALHRSKSEDEPETVLVNRVGFRNLKVPPHHHQNVIPKAKELNQFPLQFFSRKM